MKDKALRWITDAMRFGTAQDANDTFDTVAREPAAGAPAMEFAPEDGTSPLADAA